MDPITSAVTLIALVTTTRKVLVTTFKICKDMNDAPDDLLKVSRQVKFVTTFLEQLIAMEEKLGHAQVSILPLNLREMLGQAVIGVQESIDVVVQTCQVCSGKLGLHIRLRWALLKKSEATKILQLLRSAMEDLSHVIQLLQLLLVYNGASADHVDIDGAGPLHYLRWRTSPRNCMTEIEWNTTIGIPFLDFMSALSIEDFNTQDDRGNTALKLFAWSGAFGTFLRALQLGASAHMEIFPQTGAISSLLHDSAFGGSIEIMEIVLRDNPNTNINDQDTCGMTPLHKAIQSPNMNIASIELLLSWGPDVSIRDNYGQTPLCCLISQPDSLTIEPVFNILVEYGASLGTVDCLGNTLLHHATRNGSIKWMELLLKQGCDVNARNVKNVTPLHYANTQYGFVDSCRFFGESYAEARQQDLTEVIDLLFSLGADPHIVGRFPHQDLPQFHNGQWREAYSVTESSYVYCTPASLARMCPAKVFSVIFHASLHQYYPETYIDSDDDVFWEASEHLDSPGEGSEMAVVNWRDEALSETELSNGIWNVKSYHLYDKAMLVKNRAR
ncbi:hypothetical protein MMC17_006963 [Xylographa soralifera]|nr:hypothetical protein [Xylographa soralifera]